MPRYELPDDLTRNEARAVRAALDAVLEAGAERLSPWVLGGRAEALGLGVLQVRRRSSARWPPRGDLPLARRGTPPLHGRGDAR